MIKTAFWTLIFLSLFSLGLRFFDFIEMSYVYFGLVVLWIVFFAVFSKDVRSYITKWNKKYKSFFEINKIGFNYLLVLYLVLLLLQEFGIFKLLNTNYLLVAVCLTGVIAALATEKKVKEVKPALKDYLLIWVLGIVGCVLVFVKTNSLGWLSYVISLISGALIVLVGYLIYDSDSEEELDFKLSKKVGIITLIGLFILSIVLSFFIGLSAFRIVFGSVYVLFIPGFIMTYLFFKELDSLERIALGFALSISVIPLLTFYLNLIGMKINSLNVFIEIFVVIVLCLVFLKYDIVEKVKKRFSRK
ncbi:DUF1616 domain-containing protein [Candidatus Woesearchaeota archaeon]|nr:DUF1616 domain-containing protein [Candidatus Woesearchaeota archaeon]